MLVLFFVFIKLFIEVTRQNFCLPFGREACEFCRESAHANDKVGIFFGMHLRIKKLFLGGSVELKRFHGGVGASTKECFENVKGKMFGRKNDVQDGVGSKSLGVKRL